MSNVERLRPTSGEVRAEIMSIIGTAMIEAATKNIELIDGVENATREVLYILDWFGDDYVSAA